MQTFNFVVEKTSTGFSAFSTEIAVFTTGDTWKILLSNAVEATNFYLRELGSPLRVEADQIILRYQ